MKSLVIILILSAQSVLHAQTLGGSSAFNFLKLSETPQLTGLGGVNVSAISEDIGLAVNNPSQLRENMHTQLQTVFNNFYAGVNAYHLSFGYRHEKLRTNFSWALTYLDYGKTKLTDAAGNILGEFRPLDWVFQLSASRTYLQRWSYGGSLKFIHSGYGQYRASGIALDAGILYRDSSNGISVSVLAKNMGFMLKTYTGSVKDELPFDLQAGITKKLKEAPLAFSLTAQQVHRFDIRYNDPQFNNDTGQPGGNGKFTMDKLFRHFVFAAQVFPIPQLELALGYNHLRRKELNIGDAGNGLNGFSMAAGLTVRKIQFRFALSQYQRGRSIQQLGINLKLNQYFGLGRFGEKIGW